MCRYVKDVEDMAEWLLNQLKSLGVTNAEKRAIGSHTLEGKEVPLPPVIIGQLGNDPKKVSSTPRSGPWRNETLELTIRKPCSSTVTTMSSPH
jgi:hypothetical protein